ncbi:thiol:disulfide interchange protein DsbD [Pseudomonas sp. StFLB209]|uniref:protein-disulfide reductase DsbD n=1 Tax=Pseudomonas sp. StFLB209 TaxID=1028989 RepID=UPI0004F75C5C|nr:protein-disulfide reductase DsbD [Pseudomonas sp. StFLB209]BAP43692.1 thiol:disulfide interchange protein DsbD [Pseudomonas sp. StFLB209]
MRTLMLLIVLLFSSVVSANGLLGSRQAEFLPADQAFALSIDAQADGSTQLYWRITPGYYLYKQRLQFSGLTPEQMPSLPEGEAHHDDYFGDSEVYRHSLSLSIPPGSASLVKLSWQGCADAGLCYPPQSREVALQADPAEKPPLQATDQALSGMLEQQTLSWSLLIFFGLGLMLAFTPCSLPMLPILAAIVVGKGTAPGQGLLLAGVYVLSMALVYAAMGVAAALLGANLQAALQQPWVLGSFALLFVILALPMFGLFELQLPAFLRDRLDSASQQQRGGSVLSAGLLGLFSGLMIGPCMTAPLAAALLFIAQSGSALHGGLVLFALGLGMGLPLLLLVTVGNRLLPKPGAWMEQLKALFGYVFLATALLVARPLLADTLWLGLWGVLAIMLAAWLRDLARQRSARRAAGRAAAGVLGVWGVLMLVGAAGGASDPWQPLSVYAGRSAPLLSSAPASQKLDSLQALEEQLAQARNQGQWVLVDYYADWCVSCKTMETKVFANPEVQASLSGVRIVKPDVTRADTASQALLKRFEVLGPPTLLWIGPDGKERREARITGEVSADEFIRHANATLNRG